MWKKKNNKQLKSKTRSHSERSLKQKSRVKVGETFFGLQGANKEQIGYVDLQQLQLERKGASLHGGSRWQHNVFKGKCLSGYSASPLPKNRIHRTLNSLLCWFWFDFWVLCDKNSKLFIDFDRICCVQSGRPSRGGAKCSIHHPSCYHRRRRLSNITRGFSVHGSLRMKVSRVGGQIERFYYQREGYHTVSHFSLCGGNFEGFPQTADVKSCCCFFVLFGEIHRNILARVIYENW